MATTYKQQKPATTSGRRTRRALSPEAREAQLVNKAMDLAERQLDEGTASSQVITHFLKLGSMRAELEKEKIKYENKKLDAQTKSLESQEKMTILYEKAIKAMRNYAGFDDEEGYENY